MLYSFPRDIDAKCISDESMEQINDGCISNNKFETGCFCCNSPRVIILANCLPMTSKITVSGGRYDGPVSTSMSKTVKLTKRTVLFFLLVLSHITSSVWTSEI